MAKPNEALRFEQVSRIANTGNAAEGSTLPPQQRGYNRVPPPQALRMVRVEKPATNWYRVVLTWEEVIPAIGQLSGYAIHLLNHSAKDQGFQQVALAEASPGKFSIQGAAGDKVTFVAQTVMTSGLRTSLELCPTVSFVLP